MSDRSAAPDASAISMPSRSGWADWCERHPQPMWVHRAGDGAILRTNAAFRALVGERGVTDLSSFLSPAVGSPPGYEPLLGRREDLSPLVPGWALLTPEGLVEVDLLVARAPHAEEAIHVTALKAVERSLATRALAESEQRFRHLARNVPGAIFQYLLRPDGTDHVLFMSEGCLDLWEVDASDVVESASALWDMCHPDDMDALRASVQNSAETLEPWIHAWRIVAPSGRLKWLQSNGRPRRLDDGSILWDSYIFDVTTSQEALESKRLLEEELQQARHLEALGRLAGGVAHDFNNLLTVILANAEEIAEKAPTLAPEAGDISDAARRAAALTRQLLAFARRQPVVPEVVRVGDHVAASTRLFERLAKGASVEVVAGSTWTVRIDPTQLDQILTNLVANARDATGPRGRIRVSIEDVSAASGEAGGMGGAGVAKLDHVRIRVTDNGRGMTEETLRHIFDPFFTTRQDRGGTGLGLPTVYGIVAQNHGHIAVESAPGSGTTFQVLLPRYAGAAPPRHAALPKTPVAGRRVLLVEDEPAIRQLLSARLRRLGLLVTPAESAEEALAWLATREAELGLDLLVTDLALPGLRGQELAERVEARFPEVAVIAMSGYHDVRWDGPPPTLLPKPFEADSLERAVHAALSHPKRAASAPPCDPALPL